ncbi:MAG: choice-of-anchor R domain-containing protein [Acidobacteriota bacterium]
MKKIFGIALLGALSAVAAFPAIIIGNLGDAANGTSALNSNVDAELAAGFTMGATSMTITQAQASMLTVGISSFSESVVSANLYSDSAGDPSALLLSFSVSAPGGIIQNNVITLTPASSFILAAGTTYWLVLGTDASLGQSGNLAWKSSANPAAGAFATSFGYKRSGGSPPTTNLNNGNFIYQIDGDAVTTGDPDGGSGVPEPGTLGLFSLGSVGLLLLRRRR